MSAAAQIRSLYGGIPERLARAHPTFRRPLTLTEKILIAHRRDCEAQPWERGRAIVRPNVDRVATIHARHTMTRKQIGSALNAGQPVNPATGAPAALEDASLQPTDTKAKPGKDV